MRELGHAIRAKRTALNLTLEELAARAGVSRAMLSDIERDLKNPTIKVLCQIAEGLGCTVSYLLGEQPQKAVTNIQLVRKNERRILVDPQSGVERHLLAPALQHHGIEVLWYVIPPGCRTGAFPSHQHGVEEHITLVQGCLHCILGEQEVILEAGDSVFFPADVVHDFYNPGPESCHYFLVIDSSHKGEIS
jgi:transcriptional regulator with XRE-family HTH domain